MCREDERAMITMLHRCLLALVLYGACCASGRVSINVFYLNICQSDALADRKRDAAFTGSQAGSQ